MPKCEIFDNSDFGDFYTINSLCGGDFWVKIKICFFYIQGFIWGREIPYAYAQSNFFRVWAKKNFYLEAFETICKCQ